MDSQVLTWACIIVACLLGIVATVLCTEPLAIGLRWLRRRITGRTP